MPKVRVDSFSISIDGYGAGPDQSLENPLGPEERQVTDLAMERMTQYRTLGRTGLKVSPPWALAVIGWPQVACGGVQVQRGIR